MGKSLRTAGLAGLVVLAAAIAAHAAIEGQAPGQVGIRAADPTDKGTFDGTWMYVNRDVHFAMWIRTKDGKPQVRIQYQSLASPEGFETDWDGKSTYYMGGSPVTFDLAVDAGGANEITGRWSWELVLENAARLEHAKITLHRTGTGRTMALRFDDYERTVRRGSQDQTIRTPVVWSWVKVSKRELLWDELPW